MTTTTIGETIAKTISFIQSNPAAGAATFKARVRLDEGTQCSAFVRKFPALLVDEPVELGGKDTGMSPVELLLVSLGACQEILYALTASMMGIELESVQVDLKGHLDVRGVFGLDETVRPGYQTITFQTRIESNAAPGAIEALVRSVEAHCPTMDTIRMPVEVRGSVLHNGKPVATA